MGFIIGLKWIWETNFQVNPFERKYLYSRELKTVPAEMYVHMQQHEKLKIQAEKTNVPKMKVDLVQAQQDNNWQLDNWGILGISPKGSFFSYLRQMYSASESISMAFKHTLSEDDSSNEKLRYLVQVYMNPDKTKHYEDKNVLGPFPVPEGDDYWSVNGSIKLGETQFAYNDEKICLSTMGNELFGVIDSLVWCDHIKKMVCDGKSEHCTKTKADLTKAPEIKINFGETKLVFDHNDYIYFQDDDLNCRFGDICSQRDEGVCAKGTQVVLGKLFFEKYTPMFKLDTKSGETSILMVKNFKAPKERVLIWLIIGIVSAIVALLALLYIILKKRSELSSNPEEVYDQIEDQPEDEEEIGEEKSKEKLENLSDDFKLEKETN